MTNLQINRKDKKSGLGKFIFILIVLSAIMGYIYTADFFEREAPVVSMKNTEYWSKKQPISIILSDNYKLKNYQVVIDDGKNKIVLMQENLEDSNLNTKTIELIYPTKVISKKAKVVEITIKVQDKSLWNFLLGNSVTKSFDLKIDHKRPTLQIISSSNSITKGGSALVIVKALDEALDSVYIDVGDRVFKMQPYKKDGYYVSLVAWAFHKENFSAKVIAIDKAKNKRQVRVPFFLRHKKYKTSWIKASDKFIDGKISDLASNDENYENITDRLQKLKVINEDMRIANEKLIHELSSKVSNERIDSWKMKKFYPLEKAAVVATFGDERHYYYKDKDNEVSQSYHVGLDLASTKMASIKTSNAGKVVFASDNGIYGNMPMIDHGLGLYTIYGHCSSLLVEVGDELNAGDIISQTGKSGLALGDHLHFGILVQGVEVRIAEWMDKKWMKIHIDDVFKEANRIIDFK